MFPGTPALYSHQFTAVQPHAVPTSNKPKVGLAIVCRCCHGNSTVQCLLQKRGSNSCSPHKWSFPGGRLDQPGDLDDDGAVGTKRELEEECGGGSPAGLPSLIHIECCKSGKMKQTLYHVFVVDTSTEKEWEKWQPKPRAGKPTEVDVTSPNLEIQGQSFTCVNGYCWVDMSTLIEECYAVNTPDATDLQYGLVRWVKNYGEHILKTLIARSPKIPHGRRLSNPTAPPNGFGAPTAITRPRGPKPDTTMGKPRRFNMPAPRATLLQPPFLPMPPQINTGSPQSAFYRIAPSQHTPSQLSPSGSTHQSGSPHSSLGGDNPTGIVLPMHHPGQPNVMFFHHPTTNQASPSSDNHTTLPVLQPTPGLLQQAPGLIQQQPPGLMQQTPSGIIQHPAGLVQQSSTESFNTQHLLNTSSPTLVSEVTEGVAPISSHVPQRSSLVAEVSPTPVIVPSAHRLGANPHNMAMDQHHLSVLGPGHITSAPAMGNHEQALLPSAVAQLPPLGDKLSSSPSVPIRAADSGPLLPNPPTPIIPPPNAGGHHNHPPGLQQNSRKETLCKHYLSGVCPFGEKCWFAHPDPIGTTPAPPHRFPDKPPTTSVYGPPQSLPAQVPTAWMNNQNLVMAGMPQFVMASPPQSPLNSGVVTVPSAHLGALPPPRPTYPLLANQQQQPLLLMRPQRPEGQFPGSTYPMMVNQPFSGLTMPQNPSLRFDLLADLRIVDNNGYQVMKISQQVSRADHLYVSFGPHVHNYKILFGGNRPCSQSFYLVDERNLAEIVSCVHCSQQQQGLLVVGTETGSISLWDMRGRGPGHGNVTDVSRSILHPQSLPKPDEAICSLVHFATSINSAVVVGGTRGGVLSWYISQPPQKTFSPLFSDGKQHSQHSIVAMQVMGGFLVSGDSSGRVVLWSMQSQSPFVQCSFYAHSLSLSNLHVVDATHFLTVGTGPVSTEDNSLGGGLDRSPSSEGGRNLGPLEGLSAEMSQLSIANSTSAVITNTGTSAHDSNKYSINLWQFSTPPKLVSSWADEGVVNSTSFHCHTPPGNMFLALGIHGGAVKIINLPSCKVASELQFPQMKGAECSHITINHSREVPVLNNTYYRNPFRDLILTTVWSDGRIMVCQVAKQ